MTEFIQGLDLERVLIQIFAGTPEIFTAIAIMVILGLSAFFRMTFLTGIFMIGVFLLMFTGYVSSNLFVIIGILGSLIIGFKLATMFGR